MDDESTKLLRFDPKNADGVDASALSSLVGDYSDKQEISVFRLFFLNMFAFNYGLFYASVGVLLLPEEALRMFAEDHAIFLAVMLMLAGISQLISPLAGYCSDRDTHRMGRRLPYILGGNAVLLCMIGCLYLARTFMYGWTYLGLLLVAIVALNVAYTGFTGLISDVIPSSQMGFASGVMGGLTAAGAVLGLVTIGFFLPISSAYPLYAASILVTTPLTWWAAMEQPLEDAREFRWEDVWRAYRISPESHGDFFWVFVSRTFYYMAVSCQIYIMYYLRDTMQADEVSTHARRYTAILCICSQTAAGCTSLVAGGLSDLLGRKALIYLACCGMAGVYLGYCFVHEFQWVLLFGVCYGVSNGVYLACDYALAVECLPSKEDCAKDLALWGIAAFLGTMFGPCITGPLLAWVGEVPGSTHYSIQGYYAVMGVGILYCAGCGLSLVTVRGDRERR